MAHTASTYIRSEASHTPHTYRYPPPSSFHNFDMAASRLFLLALSACLVAVLAVCERHTLHYSALKMLAPQVG